MSMNNFTRNISDKSEVPLTVDQISLCLSHEQGKKSWRRQRAEKSRKEQKGRGKVRKCLGREAAAGKGQAEEIEVII